MNPFPDVASTLDDDTPQVIKEGAVDMQVCVPASWTDEEVVDFANQNNPAGTEAGWQIRREGSPYLAGAHERVQCSARPNFVHIMLDC